MKPDPTHQSSFNRLMELPDAELRRRLAVKGYKAPDFVAAEVLASLVKLRHGKSSGLMDVIAATLNERIVMLVERFFRKNPGVLRESSETLVDATVAVWAGLLKDKEALSCGYAEVRFLMFVEGDSWTSSARRANISLQTRRGIFRSHPLQPCERPSRARHADPLSGGRVGRRGHFVAGAFGSITPSLKFSPCAWAAQR